MSTTVTYASQYLSDKEVETAQRYLAATRDALVRMVTELTEAQSSFTPGPERWSIADIVEHLCALEELLVNRIVARLIEAPATPPTTGTREGDARVIGLERDPSTRVVVPGRVSLGEAPRSIQPTGRRGLDESLRRFLACRERTVRCLWSTPDLREHVVDHQALGPLDGYQWLLFVAAHTERHIQQIATLKAAPDFPKSALQNCRAVGAGL
jgi:hypothetical protein